MKPTMTTILHVEIQTHSQVPMVLLQETTHHNHTIMAQVRQFIQDPEAVNTISIVMGTKLMFQREIHLGISF